MQDDDERRSRTGLSGLNFSLAAAQTGFGPFIAVWLTRQGWDEAELGIALSIGTAAGLVGQLPAGLLVSAITRKRRAVLIGLVGIAAAALLLVASATLPAVIGAQVLHALASCVLTPAIAALTLAVCGHAAYGEALGINARWAAFGNASSGAGMGLLATQFGTERVVFAAAIVLVAAAIACLSLMRAVDHRPAIEPAEPVEPHVLPWGGALRIFEVPALHVFAICVLLFHLANAALLPLGLNALTQGHGRIDLVVSLTIILPQALVVLLAPWAGSRAQRWGRKPVLIVGFLALPLRALLFATEPPPALFVAYQALDGISAAIFGLMLPLIAADLTRRTGYLTLAVSALGLAAGIGATVSTTIAGLAADSFGPSAAFCGLAAVGALALAIVAFVMPETRPTEAEEEEATAPAASTV